MRGLLAPDAAPYRVLAWWVDLVWLSLGWYLLALPLLTAPAATDWLLDGVRRRRAGEALRGPGQTWSLLRQRFLPTWALAAVHLAVLTLLAVALLGPAPGALAPVVLVLAAVVGVTWGLVAPWSVVLLRERGTRVALRTAYLRAVRHLSLSFLSLVAVVGGVAAVLLTPGWMRLPVVLSVPGLVATVLVVCCDRAAPTSPPLRLPSPAATSPTPSHRPDSREVVS